MTEAIIQACPAERAFWKYQNDKGRIALIEWFRAELVLAPQSVREKFEHYSDDELKRHTRHVEQLARWCRFERKKPEQETTAA